MPPFLSLMTSLPFIALALLHYGNLWGLYFLITAAPKFMSEVLGFNLAQAGILASLPYLARLFSGFIFGQIGDSVRSKGLMSATQIRKSFCLFCKYWPLAKCTTFLFTYLLFCSTAHIIPGLCLIGLSFVGYHPYWCVTIITVSLGFNGASTVTNLQNSQDLAPNFAGTLYGLINFFGTTTGFITPVVVGYFTAERVRIHIKSIFWSRN